ncbi:TetR/AcrR family transcriptional regulator [Neomicrococcus lactis]|uniref:AcrR family transcriptional regulator n=1 Tax=Neomicrococcus lactis TaxID=732241 RepID=A0A7W8YBT0_9MICC|nr:TetR/AcrR family transcriptional regulator [Neomicrococcus lactis]MBB5598497.1 AcrR family transcriptional regulator [Neomicrococcus lactis]
MTARERALKAAVSVVADLGFQALTHAKVDATAKLPPGSTSNYFRTKDALVSGLIRHIADQEMSNGGGSLAAKTPEELVEKIGGLILALTTVRRELTAARMAIFLSGKHAGEIRDSFAEGAAFFHRELVATFTELGAADPHSAASALMSCAEGIILHRLTWDADPDPLPQLALVVKGALASS